MSEDIKAKLLKSDSVTSLSSERKISDLLNQFGWNTFHSSYYIDQTTQKFREIDVLGRQLWKFDNDLRADIQLVVEAKTAKDFHLIFSLSHNKQDDIFSNYDWFGLQSDKKQNEIKKILSSYISEREVESLFRTIDEFAYPSDMSKVRKLIIKPIPAPILATSFRETNSKTEKDLDNSVLWRASLAVHSAVESLKKKRVENLISDISVGIQMSINEGQLISPSILEDLLYEINRVYIFHPIVVTDSRLWIFSNRDLTENKWVRFEQIETNGRSEWWFDIVHSSYFSQYIKKLTSYYNSKLKKMKGKLENEYDRN